VSSLAPPPVEAPQESAAAYGEAAPLVIEASQRVSLGLGELWSYRELLYLLVWRNIKIRYKQAAIGVAWVVLQPILTATLFTLIFGVLLDAPSRGVAYPVFFLAGFVLWQLFATSLTEAGNSLVDNEQLVTKIYFPRLLLPMAAVFANMVDFAISMVILAVMVVVFGVVPAVTVLLLPVFVLMAVLAALGAGIWLSALNVRYRDVKAAIPFLTQLLFFATPLVYATSLIPEPWRILMGLNPMAGAVEGLRWALFGVELPLLTGVSVIVVITLFATGLLYFKRTERSFADVV
jgi:lipopolysaccharide transport system permease protein